MPFDINNDAGSTDSICGGTPTNTYMMRLLHLNAALRPGTLFPTLASGCPNPTSALSQSLGANIVTSPRSLQWVSRNYFRVSPSSVLGYEMCPNNKIKIKIGVTTYTATVGTDHYHDPLLLIGVIQNAVNAQISGLSKTFTLVFDDERYSPHFDSSATATFKWKASISSGTFEITGSTDADSIWPTLGWTADTAAATSHQATVRSIHTEEAFTLDLDSAWSGLSTSFSGYRWLVIVDPNWPATYSATKGADKCVLYLLDSAIDEIDEASASWINGTTRFHLASQLGTYEGVDSAARFSRTSYGAGMPNYWVVDLHAWRAATPRYRYARLKVVNRQNPSGHVSLGYFYLGPGWHPSRNNDWSVKRPTVNRSAPLTNPHGVFNSRFLPPSRTWDIQFSRTFLSLNDQALLNSISWAMRASSTTTGSAPVWDTAAIAAGLRNVIMIDPSYSPSIYPANSLYARGALFGRLSIGDVSEKFTNLWNCSELKMIEEPRLGGS